MAADRKCIDCGRALVPQLRGRPPLRCGECHRKRRRIVERAPVMCVDCALVFAPPGHTGLPPKRCEPCATVQSRKLAAASQSRYRARHPEQTLERQRASSRKRLADPAHRQAKIESEIQRKYGLLWAEYESLVAAQDGKCAICAGGPTGKGGRLFVDHCHATGKVRALLCHHCNTLLGLAADDPSRLRAAAQYLEKHT